MGDGCLLCRAERVTARHFEDEVCWIADCLVCATPMIVWRPHGLPDTELERRLLDRLSEVAAARYPAGFWIDGERRRIPDHWHAHARPAGGFFHPGRPAPPERTHGALPEPRNTPKTTWTSVASATLAPTPPWPPDPRIAGLKILSRSRVEAGRPATNGRTPGGRAWRGRRRRRQRIRVLVAVTALPALLAGLIAADYLIYRNRVHPGVEVANLSLSGQNLEQASAALSALAQEAKARSITFTYEGDTFETTAGDLGWEPDVQATARAALDATSGNSFFQDLWNRIRAWVEPVSVPWVARFGEGSNAVVAEWSDTVTRRPREGRITVEGTTVVRRDPEPGVEIDGPEVVALAGDLLEGRREGPLPLPVVTEAPRTTTDDVDAAQAAGERLLEGPITARIGPIEVNFLPQDLGPLVRSRVEPGAEPTTPPSPDNVTESEESEPAGGGWRIALSLDPAGVDALLDPYREQVETEPVSAEFVPAGEGVRIRRSTPGRSVDAEVAARRIMSISRKPTRAGKIPLAPLDAELTTEEAQDLGVRELVSSFTTYHSCCEPRVTNIHLGADNLKGALVMPGETFSLNQRLGQRTVDKGYVPAPGIINGVLIQTPGGGISQLTTTMFNAAFFGGYPIPQWQAHSFYFSRYPLGREATLSWPAPDLQFTNDTDHALLVWATYTDVSITVKIYSTKIRDVAATDPVITSRTDTGYWTLVERIIRGGGGEVISRDEFRTFYKNGAPLTEEEAEEEASPSPSPTPSPSPDG